MNGQYMPDVNFFPANANQQSVVPKNNARKGERYHIPTIMLDRERNPDEKLMQRVLKIILMLNANFWHLEDKDIIWTLAEDIYLLNINPPQLILVKCTQN